MKKPPSEGIRQGVGEEQTVSLPGRSSRSPLPETKVYIGFPEFRDWWQDITSG